MPGGADWGERFAPWRADPAGAAVIVDFDGTISAIVDDPERAPAAPGAWEALGALSAAGMLVGVVSGRPVAYLATQVPAPGIALVGLYGLERWEGGRAVPEPGAAAWAGVLAGLEVDPPGGVYVENKGLALTLHYRRSPEQQEWARAWAYATAERTGLAVLPTRSAYELRPPVPIDKGTVVATLLSRRPGVVVAAYIGDDTGDLPAFEALGRAGLRVAVRVAVASDEAPPELIDAADVVVDGPTEVVALLGFLAPDAT